MIFKQEKKKALGRCSWRNTHITPASPVKIYRDPCVINSFTVQWRTLPNTCVCFINVHEHAYYKKHQWAIKFINNTCTESTWPEKRDVEKPHMTWITWSKFILWLIQLTADTLCFWVKWHTERWCATGRVASALVIGCFLSQCDCCRLTSNQALPVDRL